MAEAAPSAGNCPRCAAPITIQPGAGVPQCRFCGAISLGSIDAEKAVLGNLDNRYQRKRMREELLRRKEVLETNLESIDPLSKWTGGEPVGMRKKSILVSGGVVLFGLILLGAGDSGKALGVLLVVCTMIFVISRAVSYSNLWQRYSTARATSASNRQTIQKLRADLRETDELLGQLDGQGESR